MIPGTEYTLGRVPMAGTDFSLREYSYCDTPDDFDLTTFALAQEDYDYKVWVIQSSRGLSLSSDPSDPPSQLPLSFSSHSLLYSLVSSSLDEEQWAYGCE